MLVTSVMVKLSVLKIFKKANAEHLRGHHNFLNSKTLDNVMPLKYRFSSALSMFHPSSVVIFIECLFVTTWIVLKLLNEISLVVREGG